MSKARIPLVISEATDADVPFAMHSWKLSALDAPKNREKRDSGRVGEHFTQYNRDVARVMRTEAAKLLIAREPSDPTFIYGWIAVATYYDPNVSLPRGRRKTNVNAIATLYIYTKAKFRRMGVATELKDAALKLAPEYASRFFTESTSHDPMFERWGFEERDFEHVLDLCAHPKAPKRRSA